MFSCVGKIEINNGIRIITNNDFCLYYQWLIKKHYYNLVKIQTPTHGAHVTIFNPKIHKNLDLSSILSYAGREVTFDCFPENLYVSPVNFWIPVVCEFADFIKKEINLDDGPNYWGLHLTVSNKKNL